MEDGKDGNGAAGLGPGEGRSAGEAVVASEAAWPMCRDGVACKVRTCRFTHPEGRVAPARRTSAAIIVDRAAAGSNSKTGVSATAADVSAETDSGSAQMKDKTKGGAAVKPWPECRNGAACIRKDCRFMHPEGRVVAPGRGEGKVAPCRFGAACTRENCYFVHPEGRAEASPSSTAGDVVQSQSPTSGRGCRYGMRCRRGDCRFSHPAGWNPSSSVLSTSEAATLATKGPLTSASVARTVEAQRSGRQGLQANVVKVPMHLLARSFVGRELGPLEAGDGYRAAGLVIFKMGERADTGPCVLLGTQIPKDERVTAGVARSGLVQAASFAELNFIGGKRDEDDTEAETTAWREFTEETCGALGDAAEAVRESVFGDKKDGTADDLGARLFWVRDCKYVLFLGKAVLEAAKKLEVRFLDAQRALSDAAVVEMERLLWVPIRALLDLTADLAAKGTDGARAQSEKIHVDLSALASEPRSSAKDDSVDDIVDQLGSIRLHSESGLYPPPKKLVLHNVLLQVLLEPCMRDFLQNSTIALGLVNAAT